MADGPVGNGPEHDGGGQSVGGMDDFGEAVLALCRAQDLSLSELARRAFLNVGLISKVVRGKTLPTLETAAALDSVLESGETLVTLAQRAREQPRLNLPAAGLFVGREVQLARLNAVSAELTTASPPVVIVVTGAPGVGKTALAMYWANGAKADFDTVLWSDVRGYTGRQSDGTSPTCILEDLLRGFGVPANRVPASEDDRLRTLQGELRRQAKKVLIVLDNVRNLAQVKPVLPRIPGTTVLITSRRRIVGLAQEARTIHVSLAPMSESDSTQLIATLIGDERAEQEPVAVDRLVRLCASLPLALSIAGNLIAADPSTSVQQHADALADRGRLNLLDGEDGAIGVRAAFSWSYEASAPEDAAMFRLLGLHPGPGFSVGAAAALAGVVEAEAIRILDHLTQANLVQQLDAQFYRLHDLLRAYAAEEIAAEARRQERRDAVARLVRWWVHGTNAAAWALMPARDHHVDLGPAPNGVHPISFDTADAAMTWCVAELANITPMAQLALDYRLWWDAWRAPTDLIDFFVLGRPLDVWQSSTEIALLAAEEAGDPAMIAEALDKLAEVCRRRHDHARADELDRRALALLQPLEPTHPRLGWPLIGLGNTAHAEGRFDDAVDLISRGVVAFVAAHSRIGELAARMHLGRALRSAGDRDQALHQGHLALAGFHDDGDRHGEASALVPLARTCHTFGDLPEALDYSDQAAVIFREVSDPWGEADALGVKGLVLNDLGRPDEGLRSLTMALRLVETLDDCKAQQLRSAIEGVASPSKAP